MKWTTKQHPLQLPIVLGMAHGLADAAAGFLLGVLPNAFSLDHVVWLILIYNGLAFGGQPLVGLLADRLQRLRLVVWIGLALLGLGLVLFPHQGYGAIVLAGLGSSAFHVGGGALAYASTPNQTTGAGFFVAPGVAGLAIGGALGLGGYPVAPVLLGLLLGVSGAIACLNMPTLPYLSSQRSPIKSPSDLPEETKETLLMLLIVAIALGSVVWTGLQLGLLGQTNLLVGMAIAAALGKIAGGWLATRWGWRRWAIAALIAATVLLVGGGTHPISLLLGVACLQSAVPITLTATMRLMPNYPATAAGLALGLAILLGGVPVLAGVTFFPQAIALTVLLLAGAAIALWVGLKPQLNPQPPAS